jgi:hypothetical protein
MRMNFDPVLMAWAKNKFGGAGGGMVFDSGSFTGLTGDTLTIQHGLGVVPDMVILYTTSKATSTTYMTLQQYCGCSSAFAAAAGSKFNYMFSVMRPTSSGATTFTVNVYSGYAQTASIDNNVGLAFVSMVHAANDKSFSIKNGAGGVSLETNFTYNWLAIGGLT